MTSRILWGLKLLCIGVALAGLCAAEDGNSASNPGSANANQRPHILARAQAPQMLPEQTGAVISDKTSPDDWNGMEKTLAEYQSAFEAMNLRRIQGVWPGLDRRRAAAFRGVFDFLRNTPSAPRLDLQCAAPVVVEQTVQIECRQALTYWREDDHKLKTVGPVRVAILMRKESNNWFVQSMKGL